MNFRDEYKKEISEISPDEAALERIRSGVAKRLAEPEVTKKKPLPLRRIAVIGGSAAACLVIGVTAVAITGGGRSFTNKTNNMNGSIAPTAGASGGGMMGGANAAPNLGMSSTPNFDNVNEADCTDQGGMSNTEDIMGSDGYGDAYAGEFSPDTSIPAGGAEAQEPSSTAAARITLDGDMLTLGYNGETTVFTARFNDSDSIGKDGETGLGVRPVRPAESAERIEVISSDGEIMFLELRDDEAVLFNSENEVLGVYVRVE